MITCREYNEEERIDRVWYDSSNVLYSECEDRLNELKVLTVVFKGGATYRYKDVDVNDYVMFIHGGLDGSNGKALNKFIKKYEFEKLDKTDLTKLEERKQMILEAKKEKSED